ncbi:hypothetical protein SDC9_144201 [bioreactor metagenome]|uniref:Uncharacterized protein n=1 Tax=bioreactor metagenome TaxID=1076179 RepID=A0A645E5G2_9ZZZZ
METIYYLDGNFYSSELHKQIPPGAAALTREEWSELQDARATGKRIVTGADGRPELENPPEIPFGTRKSDAIARLWRNHKAHQQRYVDAEDLTLAVVCAAAGSAKGAAVQSWVMQLWARYYQVRDAVEAAADAEALAAIDLSADGCGEPPFTIRELNEEAAAAAQNGGNE